MAAPPPIATGKSIAGDTSTRYWLRSTPASNSPGHPGRPWQQARGPTDTEYGKMVYSKSQLSQRIILTVPWISTVSDDWNSPNSGSLYTSGLVALGILPTTKTSQDDSRVITVPAKNGKPSTWKFLNDAQTVQDRQLVDILRGTPYRAHSWNGEGNPYLFYFVRAPPTDLPSQTGKKRKADVISKDDRPDD
ncbi:hypothetical protein BT63DRAFT_452537 [Microthyrium microscopicum]|uniref:Uncharacterized protein n=1 Tax=Microthyrium microscopicum TaxID=703497 RepID=A0A6A6UJU8_9PEZI|nr:hypothetical protein BT63DRAFT_452537 [Microthyrium microscopicum]